MQSKSIKKRSSEGKKRNISKKNVIVAALLLFFAFFGSFIIYFILQIALNTQTPMVVVVSDSMSPNINKGDLLILRGMDPEDIKEGTREAKDGDVIVYDARGLWDVAPEEPIVHRVVDKWKEDGTWYFQTKGDANSRDDPEPVPENRILGVVCGRVPYVGWIKITLTDTGLFIPLIIIISIPLIISIIWDILKPEEEEKEEKLEKVKKIKEDARLIDRNKDLDEIELDEKHDDEFDF